MEIGFIGALFIICIYFLPYFVAKYRKHKNSTLIGFMNLIFGWSVIGWLAILIWASVTRATEPADPVIVVNIPASAPENAKQNASIS